MKLPKKVNRVYSSQEVLPTTNSMVETINDLIDYLDYYKPSNRGIRRFLLDRETDVSGVSGTGIVAEGVVFSDKSCVVHWLGEYPTTTPHPNIDSVLGVHGHNGHTNIVWLDN